MHRGNDVVVSEYEKDASEEVNGWQQHGAESRKRFAGFPLEKFDYGDGVDYQNQGDRPDENAAENSRVDKQQKDSKRFAPIALDKRGQNCLRSKANQAQNYRREDRLHRSDQPILNAKRAPIETERKMQASQKRNAGDAQERADPVVPIARLYQVQF
ncbi:MAG: hypothetical protein WBD45_25360 [Terriglobales bacterium]